MAKTLPEKGELLSNYYAVTKGDLANEIALLSGQGPNPATAANCPEYKDFATPTLSATGQAEGEGCVYPAETETLPGQLVAAKKTWKAYVGGIGNGQAGEPTSCRHPGARRSRPRPGAAAGGSVRDLAQPLRLLPLDRRQPRMRRTRRRPRTAQRRPEEGSPHPLPLLHRPRRLPRRQRNAVRTGGARRPRRNPAVARNGDRGNRSLARLQNLGLIAITSAQARQDLPEPDTSACCGTPEYPNLPPPKRPRRRPAAR